MHPKGPLLIDGINFRMKLLFIDFGGDPDAPFDLLQPENITLPIIRGANNEFARGSIDCNRLRNCF